MEAARVGEERAAVAWVAAGLVAVVWEAVALVAVGRVGEKGVAAKVG